MNQLPGMSFWLLGLVLAAVGGLLARRALARERRAAATLEESLAEARAESRQLRAAVEAMPEGVLVTDAEGQVSFVNPRWRSLFGSTPELDLQPPAEAGGPEPLRRMLNATLQSGESRQLEIEVSTDSEAQRSLLLTSASLGESGGAVVVAEDVTKILRLTKMRSDFVANVSHELKTPLSAIRGFAETLVDGAQEDPKTAKRFLKRILKQCTRLEALLSDLLTLSRLEHALDVRTLSPVDLGPIVSEAIEELGDRLAKRELELTTELRPVPPIEGDARALERLCGNLLANAVKYNRRGGAVGVRLYASGSEVVLEVEDSGIGIPEESIPRLFERFYRVDKGRSRKEGGTGLGLAIVKHAAGLHGGSVEVESRLGHGSLFRARLPVA